jgi:hypothetical protein
MILVDNIISWVYNAINKGYNMTNFLNALNMENLSFTPSLSSNRRARNFPWSEQVRGFFILWGKNDLRNPLSRMLAI